MKHLIILLLISLLPSLNRAADFQIDDDFPRSSKEEISLRILKENLNGNCG